MNEPKTAYIALLRGINVGGHNIKMESMRELFRELDLDNVRSYIQTGNIFFDTDEIDRIKLRKRIENHLQSALGYKVAVCLRTIAELEAILNLNPFKGIELTPETRFSVTFLAEAADEMLPVPSKTPDGGFELIAMTPTELFVVWHLKNGRPGSSNGFGGKFEKESTTRFWHTTSKILSAAKQS